VRDGCIVRFQVVVQVFDESGGKEEIEIGFVFANRFRNSVPLATLAFWLSSTTIEMNRTRRERYTADDPRNSRGTKDEEREYTKKEVGDEK